MAEPPSRLGSMMFSWRKISVVLLTSGLLLSSLPTSTFAVDTVQPGNGAPNGPAFTPPEDPEVIKDARSILRGMEPSSSNNAMVYFDQNQVNFKSFISLEKQSAGGASAGAIICQTPNDPKCVSALADSSFQQIKYDVAMGSCDARQIAACIKSFTLIKDDGTKVTAVPITRIYSKTSPGWASTFNSKTNSGYPGSDGPWIWRINDGAKSTDYLILGLVSALFNRPSGTSNWDASEKSLRLSIYPIKKFESPMLVEGSGETGCLAVDTGVCYQRIAFASNLRFALDLRIPKVITGWLNGRLEKPAAYTENYNDDYSELIVEASPLEEIMTGKWLANTGAVSKYLDESRRGLTAGAGKNLDIAGVDPDDQSAVRYYSSMATLFNNTALTNSLTWRLNTTSSGAQSFATSCQKSDGVQGIVTSNASVYEPGSPKWDGNEGSLAYKIAAPTYKPDGKTENVGRYAFTMRADLIKCVYGMSTLPAYANIEVTYDGSGEKKTATVVLGSNKEWVNLHADNFMYTGAPPTVSVKLDGWAKSTSAATPKAPSNAGNQAATPATPSPSAGKVTITCIKGTTKKLVTAVKPQCPSGYKMQNTAAPAAQQVQVTVTCTKGTTKKTVTGIKPQCPAGYKMSSVTPVNAPTAPAQPAARQPEVPANMPAPNAPAPQFNPNADITITCTKGAESKQVTGKSPVQCPSGYQMTPMGPGQQPNAPTPQFDPNADITITCIKGSESKQVTGKSPVQCPSGYQMKPMGPGQPGVPGQPLDPNQPGLPMQPAKQ